MRRNTIRIMMAVFLIGVVSLLSACGQSKPNEANVAPVQSQEPPQEAEETFDLHGDYAIDISDLGMALTFYLRIREDNTFVLSANRQFSDDRGSGTIGELDGTYLMIYSDSTPDKSKTATFERIGPNLIFRSTLPYGSANIMFEREDEENPEIIYHLMGHKYIYEEYYDTYLGSQTVDGVEYEYVLDLGAGARYKLNSSKDSAEGSVYEEKGAFRVSSNTIKITPDGEQEFVGSILDDGALELDVKPEASAQRAKVLFRVATTAEHAGDWYAQNEAGEKAALRLDYFGGYTLTTGSTKEEGTFAVSQGAITFRKHGEELESTGTKELYVLKASFHDEQWVFYEASIQGHFTGGTMVNESYAASLQLEADGTFALEILDQEGDVVLVNESGSFTINPGFVSYMITLNSEDGTVRVGDIWPTGLNMTFDISGTSYSFLLTK